MSDIERIQILTAQNVGIQYETANLGDRLLAGIIDGLIMMAIAMGFFFIGFQLNLLENFWFGLAIWFAIVLYPFMCELLLNGQTIGKLMRNIRVSSRDGSPARLYQFLLRWLIGLLENIMLFGTPAIITLTVRPKGQRLGDMAAGTVVVKLSKGLTLDETILMVLQNDYQPQFPETTKLKASEIELIKDVLKAIENSEDRKMRLNLATRTKRTIEKKLGISSTLAPTEFLDVILKDFNYYQG